MNKLIVPIRLCKTFTIQIICLQTSLAFALSRVGFGGGNIAKKTKLDLSVLAKNLTNFESTKSCVYFDEKNREVEIFSNNPCPPRANGKVRGILKVPDFRNRVLVFAADTPVEQSEILASDFFVKTLPQASKPGILAAHLKQNWGKKKLLK